MGWGGGALQKGTRRVHGKAGKGGGREAAWIFNLELAQRGASLHLGSPTDHSPVPRPRVKATEIQPQRKQEVLDSIVG
jgi:hypothetical protein